MSIRSLSAGALAMAGPAMLLARPAAAETQVYEIPFEKAMSWSGVMLPWGADGYLDWVIADGGNPGKALRVTSALRRRAVTYELRTLMFNHEPGTKARISLDIRLAAHPKGSRFMVRWYDGYVSAEAFEKSADDPFEDFPPPILVREEPPQERGWQTFDFETPQLKHTVLTLAFLVSQPPDPDKEEQDQFIDYYLDNLRVETTPLSRYMDPGFDWHGKGGSTVIDWRWTTQGAHVDWCDFMDDTEAAWGDGRVIDYDLATFRDTGSRPMHVKHNYVHDTANGKVGGASVIMLVRNHPEDVSASWGVRQTVSYAAFGLGPEDGAHIAVTIKYAFHKDGEQTRYARLQVGCDPEGGILTEDALWSAEDPDVNWREGQWRRATLEFDRPKVAPAFTVFFRVRDGILTGDKGRVRATSGIGRAVADWILIEASKQ